MLQATRAANRITSNLVQPRELIMNRTLTALLAGALILATVGVAQARGDHVRIGVDVPYVPMEFA
tara:strand:- start:483 stop:677 length:195 start_codon:yes stop_codon:yes gene_type:complete